MPRALLIIGACLALLVAGCGDDSSTTAETSASTTAEEATTEEGSTTTEEGPPAADGGKGQADGRAVNKTKPKVSVPEGPPPTELVVNDIEVGSGREAKAGDEVAVHYVGVDYKSGSQFDASWDRGEPFFFELGAGAVIPGWDQGIEGMKVGGRRELVIPPDLAYGSQAVGEIAANSTLVFVVDLLGVR